MQSARNEDDIAKSQMGFDWGVTVSLEYGIPIKLDEKASLWYMLKRLAEY